MQTVLNEIGSKVFRRRGGLCGSARLQPALERSARMPRYYFDLIRDGKLQRDEFGDEFENFEEARAQAQALLPDITKEHLPDGDLHKIRCNVRDESGRTVYRGEITFQGTKDPEDD